MVVPASLGERDASGTRGRNRRVRGRDRHGGGALRLSSVRDRRGRLRRHPHGAVGRNLIAEADEVCRDHRGRRRTLGNGPRLCGAGRPASYRPRPQDQAGSGPARKPGAARHRSAPAVGGPKLRIARRRGRGDRPAERWGRRPRRPQALRGDDHRSGSSGRRGAGYAAQRPADERHRLSRAPRRTERSAPRGLEPGAAPVAAGSRRRSPRGRNRARASCRGERHRAHSRPGAIFVPGVRRRPLRGSPRASSPLPLPGRSRLYGRVFDRGRRGGDR